jgi:serine protease Do
VSFRPAFASRRPLASIPSWCAAALRSACATAFVAVLALTAVPAPASARSAPEGFADLAEALLPAVVNVSTTQTLRADDNSQQNLEEMFKDFFDRQNRDNGDNGGGGDGRQPEPRRATSLGSGFIIDPSGYIVTNNHVIEGADQITVRLHDDTELEAKIIGIDTKTDLALLKVEPKSPLPAVHWGDSDKTRIGDWVLAIGNPFGLGGSVTAGIVSARQRDINAGPYDDFIQTDASINRGNSGGPMFDMDGGVIGINTAIYSPSGGSVGIGFAIPSNLARTVIEQLKDFGHARRGWLGVRIQSVSPELAEGLRLPTPKGALVANVTAGGPADAAGIKQGDVILEFNGHAIDEMRKLPRVVAETPIDQDVSIVVWRQGEKKTLSVKVGELQEETEQASAESTQPKTPTAPANSGKVDLLGLVVTELTAALRDQYKLEPDVAGVLVSSVDANGPAAEKGLQEGDVIIEVDQKAVKTPADVKKRVDDAKGNGYRVVTLLVYRGGDFQWVAVRIDNKG